MPDEPNVPPGYAQATVAGLYGPASWENVLWFGILTPGGGTDLQTADDVGAAAANLYSGFDMGDFSEDWGVSTVKVLYRPLTGDMVKSVTVASAAGTNSSGGQGAQVAYLLNWVTSDYRRGGKPRTYVCGVPDDRLADSANLDSSVQSNFNDAIASWISDIALGTGLPNGSLLELVEMSFVDGGVERDTPLGFPVSGGILNPILATQRRRVDRLR